MSEHRIQKILAASGICSRREGEALLKAGRIKVNQEIAGLGDKCSFNDQIYLDGKLLKLPKQSLGAARVLLYHKPVGEICSHDMQDDRPTIYHHFPYQKHGKWMSVGRLDVNSCGLVLITNDGELLNKLAHPSRGFIRTYRVRVFGTISAEHLKRLKTGVQLDDGKASFNSIKPLTKTGSNQWFEVSLKAGKNRMVRRLFEAVDAKVNRLIRTGFGPFILPKNLHPTEWIELEPAEVLALQAH